MGKAGRPRARRDSEPEFQGRAALGRMRGEGQEAYDARRRYLEAGPTRTLLDVAKAVGKHHNLIGRWSSRWRWIEAAGVYDSHLATVALEEVERRETARAAEWERRRIKEADRVYDIAMRLGSKADEMLNAPLRKSKIDKDGKTIILEPVRWTMATAASMLKLSTELASIAIGEATGDDGFDPETATPEECAEYARKAFARRKQVKELMSRESMLKGSE